MFPVYDDITRTKLIADKRRLGTANLFGIIAYTDANPNIKKVLRDKDYWDCFDAISCGWIIYAIRPEYGQRVSFSSGKEIGESARFDYSYDFLSDFGIDNNEQFPMLIVCALAEEDSVASIRVPLDDSTEGNAANNLKELITDITRVLQQIENRYKSSTTVLREVESELTAKQAKASFRKASRALICFLKTATSFINVF